MKWRLMGLFIVFGMLLNTVVVAQDTPEPTSEPTETPIPEPTRLRIWLPELLASPNDPAVLEWIQAQADAFIETQENVEIEFRIKKVDEVGGILSTLLSASEVAPGAMPELTLLRFSDLQVAVREELLQPLEGLVSSAIVGDLDRALLLGQVDDNLYGLPYLLDFQHVVYRSDQVVEQWAYADLLEREDVFVFPAGRATGVSDVFFLQYLASGGTLPIGENVQVDPVALENTLGFYESLREQALIDEAVLNYTSQADYRSQFTNGEFDVGVFSSTDYLEMIQTDETLMATSIPTQDGTSTTMMEGWMWVLLTSDLDQQDLATAYLDWIMDATRQSAYAQMIWMLPSQRNVLQETYTDQIDTDLFIDLLDNAVLPVQDEAGTFSRAMQNALISVLFGEMTAIDATNIVVGQFDG